MRKIIFKFMSIAMIISLVMTSCSKDDEKEELTLSQLSVTMVHDDTVTVSANQKATFSSADPFVATVSDNGKITAKHVGQTVVTATVDGQTKECTVTVKPVSNLYKEPILDFNLTKNDVKAQETRPLEDERDLELIYTDKKTYLMHYNFDPETSKLKSVTYGMPNISYAQSSVLTDFLTERYQPIDYTDKEFYFVNSDEPNNASMIVMMTLSVNNLQIDAGVVYMKKQ